MELATPAALWALAALAIVFLLPRLRVPRSRMPVANAFLWREALTSERPRFTTRVHRNLLLILQVCAVAALVFALARPMLLTGAATVAVIVDVSASMGARDGAGTRLDAARHAILDRLSGSPFGTRVRLMLAGPSVSTLGEFSASGGSVKAALDRIRPTAGTSAIADAIAAARAISPDRIVVVTDTGAPEGVRDVEWVAVGETAANVAVSELGVRHLLRSPLDAELLVAIRNFGPERKTVLVVREDDREIHRGEVHLAADGTWRLVLPLRQPTGVLTASIDADDALSTDDVRFALARARPRVPVTLVTRGGFFLERALAANPAVELRQLSPEDFERDGATSGVIVCDACADVPSGGDGVLMVPPAKPTSADVRLDVTDSRHPVAVHLAQSDVTVRSSAAVPLPADAVVLARAGGAPALALFERDGRRFAVAAVEMNAGSFPRDTAYPVLIAQVIEWLATRPGETASLVAGEAARWPIAGAGALAVTAPDGKVFYARRSGNHATFGSTMTPGVYTAAGGRRFVVNPPGEAESDLRVVKREERRMTAGVLPAAVREGRALPLDRLLLLIAVLVMGFEWRAYCRARTL